MPRFPHTPALYLLAPLAGGIALAIRFAPAAGFAPVAGSTPAFSIASVINIAAAPGPLLAVLGLGALAALIAHLKNRARLFTLSAFCALAAAGALRTVMLRDSQSDPSLLRCADSRLPVALEGVIDGAVQFGADRLSFPMRVDTIWFNFVPWTARGRVLVRMPRSGYGLRYGDRLVLRGALRTPQGARNPGAFDYGRYLEARGISALFSVSAADPAARLNRGEGIWFRARVIAPARAFIRGLVDSALEGDAAALLKGLLLGARSEITPELRAAFSRLGVIHVLAVSGLHVGFVLLALIGLMRLLGLPDPWRGLAALPGLLFYAELTGSAAPVVRAALMAAVLLLGRILNRHSRPLNSLAFAAALILIFRPLELFQAGFAFSFSAVTGILLIYQRLSARLQGPLSRWRARGCSVRVYLVSLFTVSAAAQLATLPLTVQIYGRLPLLSLPANLLVVPMVAVILALGFLAAAGGLIWAALGRIYLNVAGLCLELLIALIRIAQQCPFASMDLPHLPFPAVLAYLAALALFAFWPLPAARRRLAVLLALIPVIWIWHHALFAERGLRVTFFDVGQGDAALFEFPERRVLVVDCGESGEHFDAGRDVLAPYLRRRGIRTLDAVVLTHAHSDHIGGAAQLIEGWPVRRLFHPGTPGFEAIDSLACVHGVPVLVPAAGDTLGGFRGAAVWVLHPLSRDLAGAGDELNNSSIVLKVIYGGCSFLLAADAEKEAEAEMLRFGPLLRSDLLKVGHHGSATSSSATFLQRVSPRFAVVSVGRFNRFGLPDDAALEACRRCGSRVVRTDENGAAVFLCNGLELRRIR